MVYSFFFLVCVCVCVCLILFSNLVSYVNFVAFAVLCSRPEHVSNFVDAESFFGPVCCSSILYLL